MYAVSSSFAPCYMSIHLFLLLELLLLLKLLASGEGVTRVLPEQMAILTSASDSTAAFPSKQSDQVFTCVL